MEYAKKLALIDPAIFQRHQEYKEIQKPTDLKVKSDLSLEMRRILNDDSLSDDVKCKMYKRALDRYLSIKNDLGEQLSVAVNPINEPKITKKTPKKKKRSPKWLPY